MCECVLGRGRVVCLLVGWLLNVPATCISGMEEKGLGRRRGGGVKRNLERESE